MAEINQSGSNGATRPRPEIFTLPGFSRNPLKIGTIHMVELRQLFGSQVAS